MSEQIKVRVPAKVNLALLVGGVDADGYHELGTVFHAVSLFDDVTAEAAPPGTFELTMTGLGAEWLPTDDRNLAIRAAKLLASRYRVADAGVQLTIHKRIPIAGGMAGGSADAAGTLLACSVLWDVDVSPDELGALAAELGADVPFPLLGGVAIGTGRGDQLVPLLTRGRLHWVFATSHGGLSTPTVFRRFDELRPAGSTALPEALLSALATGDTPAIASALVNDLEVAALDLDPALAEVLSAGREAGALGAIVSGSGPTCAFLVASKADGLRVAAALEALPDVGEAHRAWGPVPGAQLMN